MGEKKYTLWFTGVLGGILLSLFLIAMPTIIIDPVFHYRAPLQGISYNITEPRYYNNGIAKHFSYNALITGTSMTQRFLTSEFDALWGANSIKLPYPGGGYKEIGDNVLRAISANKELEYVLWGLDTNRILREIEKDAVSTTYRPEYLYDNNLFNDVEYLLNKEILLDYTLSTISYTIKGKSTTSFDQYLNNQEMEEVTGEEVVFSGYERSSICHERQHFTPDDKKAVIQNIEDFIEPIVRKNEDVQFYFFFTPYSIVWWDEQELEGKTELFVEGLRTATEKLLTYDNVKVFCFFDNYDMICDLDNYCDTMHYKASINSKILEWIYSGEYQLNSSDYNDYFEKIKSFYLNFDYDAYIEKETREN